MSSFVLKEITGYHIGGSGKLILISTAVINPRKTEEVRMLLIEESVKIPNRRAEDYVYPAPVFCTKSYRQWHRN